jgi:hypothetical protein
MITKYKDLFNKYPFLTVVSYNGQEFTGIVQNQDSNFTNFYDISLCRTAAEKQLFLELADQWWWESNRLLPINIFLKTDWLVFKHTLRTFNNKPLEIICGHVVNLNNINQKRIKRRSIQLIKKP